MNIAKLQERKVIAGLGVILIATFLGTFFILQRNNGEQTLIISRGDFVQEVSISGKVIAAQNVELAFDQSGRVSGVYTHVGAQVAQGNTLASIENGDVRADVLKKKAALQAAQAKLEELLKGTRPEELAVSRAKVQSAKVELADARESLNRRISDAYVKSDDAVRAQADQFFSSAQSQGPQLSFVTEVSLEERLENERVEVGQMLDRWNTLRTSEVDLQIKSESSAVYLAKINTFLEDAALALSNATAYSSVSGTTISGWSSDISGARTAVSTASVNLSAASGAVESAEAALELAEKELLLKEAGVTEEAIAVERANVQSAEADLLNAQAKYQKTLIIAPFSGIVSRVDAKVGGTASPNTSLISMISDDVFQIESFVPEINTPLVNAGNEAKVTLDAYGSGVVFPAEIISVDPAETIRDGVSTYRALFRFMEKDERVRSGMTANIVVTTLKKSDVIAIPQGIVIERGDEKFVLVKEEGGFTERLIETGDVSSFGTIEILSGLNEGDMVLLKVAED